MAANSSSDVTHEGDTLDISDSSNASEMDQTTSDSALQTVAMDHDAEDNPSTQDVPEDVPPNADRDINAVMPMQTLVNRSPELDEEQSVSQEVVKPGGDMTLDLIPAHTHVVEVSMNYACQKEVSNAISVEAPTNAPLTPDNNGAFPSNLSGPRINYKVRLDCLLPKKIPEGTLHAVDSLKQMLITTVEKKIQLYRNHQLKGKVNAAVVDLTFPLLYADTLKNDRSLVAAIVKPIFTVIEDVTELILPEVGIDVLHYLLGPEENMLQAVGMCTSIAIHFCAKNSEEIKEHLPPVIEHLLKLSPTSIDCSPKGNAVTYFEHKSKPFTQLKKHLSDLLKPQTSDSTAISFKYYGHVTHVISKGEKNAKRKLKNQDPSSAASPGPPNKKPKQAEKKTPKSKEKVVKFELISGQKEMTFFTFDSLEPQLRSTDTGQFTAYSYWQLDKVHRYHTGKETTIAIIDGGIDASHPAFNRGNILYFKDYSGNINLNPAAISHGTLCAGIAGGDKFQYTDPQSEQPLNPVECLCPPGVAPDAKLEIYKIIEFGESKAIWTSVFQALQEIDRRSKNIDVVCMSLGMLQFVPEIAHAITTLVNKNIIVVCAASNLGYRFSQPICYPARLGHTLCIGSHGHHGKPSAFSPVGQQIDFLAPGENIIGPSSALLNHSVQYNSGTSFAAPAVAGLICLILGYIRERHPNDLHHFKNQWVMKEILREISTSPGRHSDDLGFGALNPLRFFEQPDRVLVTINTDVITRPNDYN